MRDITLEDTIYMDFTTRAFATGIPTVLSNTPVLSVLEENNATPITAGVSVDVDRASVVGLNMATIIATAANGYEAGKGYSVYISTGTVDSVSVIGEVVGQFTIQANPVNWAKVTAPTTAVDLSATDIQLADTVTTLTNLPSIPANWLTAAGINAGALDGKGDWSLASVLGALADAAAADEVTTGDTLVQYVKQLINILVGTPGVVTLKAAAAPASGVSLSEMIRSIYDDTNSLDATKIPDTLSLANINTQVLDVLNVDVITLPGQVNPPLTPTHREAIGWLYKTLRNRKSQSATLWTLFADDQTTSDATAVVSDAAGTAIKQEIIAGI